MTWRDRLRPGSFRGVPFYTLSSEREGGRRGTVLEFPQQDTPGTQDLGKATVRFTVTAIVIGADYDQARDRLIQALEQGGPGKLVHRYYGELQAEIEPGKTYRVVDSPEQGGMATFTIPFIPAGQYRAPTIGVDSAAQVVKSADRAKAASQGAFIDRLNLSGPEFVRTSVLGVLRRANNEVSAINDVVTSSIASVNEVASMISALGNNVATLVASPARIAELGGGMYVIHDALFGAVSAIGYSFLRTANAFGPGGSVEEKAKAQIEARKIASTLRYAQAQAMLVGAAEPPITGDTSRGQQRAQNQKAVLDLVRQAATIEAARASVSLPYDSRATALAMRDQLDVALRGLAEDSEDDDVYTSMIDLRAEVMAHLALAAGDLPSLVNHYPARTTPALLIAHIVHGDARRHEEIIARNDIHHPGFVLGGHPVQVLADA